MQQEGRAAGTVVWSEAEALADVFVKQQQQQQQGTHRHARAHSGQTQAEHTPIHMR